MNINGVISFISEYGHGNTVRAVQGCFDQGRLTEAQARQLISLVSGHYLEQTGRVANWRLS